MSNTIFNDSNAKIKVKIGSSGGISGSTLGANAITITSSSSGQGKLTDLLDVEDIDFASKSQPLKIDLASSAFSKLSSRS